MSARVVPISVKCGLFKNKNGISDANKQVVADLCPADTKHDFGATIAGSVAANTDVYNEGLPVEATKKNGKLDILDESDALKSVIASSAYGNNPLDVNLQIVPLEVVHKIMTEKKGAVDYASAYDHKLMTKNNYNYDVTVVNAKPGEMINAATLINKCGIKKGVTKSPSKIGLIVDCVSVSLKEMFNVGIRRDDPLDKVKVYLITAPETENDPGGKTNVDHACFKQKTGVYFKPATPFNPTTVKPDKKSTKNLLSYHYGYKHGDHSPYNQFFTKYDFELSELQQKNFGLFNQITTRLTIRDLSASQTLKTSVEPVVIPDSGNANNKKDLAKIFESILKLFSVFKGGKTKTNPSESNKLKFNSVFQQKRSGDWLQALLACLVVNGSRQFCDLSENPMEAINFDEIYLCTHDRILLAFALMLGLNVIFTHHQPSGPSSLFVYRIQKPLTQAEIEQAAAAAAAADNRVIEEFNRNKAIYLEKLKGFTQIFERINLMIGARCNSYQESIKKYMTDETINSYKLGSKKKTTSTNEIIFIQESIVNNAISYIFKQAYLYNYFRTDFPEVTEYVEKINTLQIKIEAEAQEARVVTELQNQYDDLVVEIDKAFAIYNPKYSENTDIGSIVRKIERSPEMIVIQNWSWRKAIRKPSGISEKIKNVFSKSHNGKIVSHIKNVFQNKDYSNDDTIFLSVLNDLPDELCGSIAKFLVKLKQLLLHDNTIIVTASDKTKLSFFSIPSPESSNTMLQTLSENIKPKIDLALKMFIAETSIYLNNGVIPSEIGNMFELQSTDPILPPYSKTLFDPDLGDNNRIVPAAGEIRDLLKAEFNSRTNEYVPTRTDIESEFNIINSNDFPLIEPSVVKEMYKLFSNDQGDVDEVDMNNLAGFNNRDSVQAGGATASKIVFNNSRYIECLMAYKVFKYQHGLIKNIKKGKTVVGVTAAAGIATTVIAVATTYGTGVALITPPGLVLTGVAAVGAAAVALKTTEDVVEQQWDKLEPSSQHKAQVQQEKQDLEAKYEIERTAMMSKWERIKNLVPFSGGTNLVGGGASDDIRYIKEIIRKFCQLMLDNAGTDVFTENMLQIKKILDDTEKSNTDSIEGSADLKGGDGEEEKEYQEKSALDKTKPIIYGPVVRIGKKLTNEQLLEAISSFPDCNNCSVTPFVPRGTDETDEMFQTRSQTYRDDLFKQYDNALAEYYKQKLDSDKSTVKSSPPETNEDVPEPDDIFENDACGFHPLLPIYMFLHRYCLELDAVDIEESFDYELYVKYYAILNNLIKSLLETYMEKKVVKVQDERVDDDLYLDINAKNVSKLKAVAIGYGLRALLYTSSQYVERDDLCKDIMGIDDRQHFQFSILSGAFKNGVCGSVHQNETMKAIDVLYLDNPIFRDYLIRAEIPAIFNSSIVTENDMSNLLKQNSYNLFQAVGDHITNEKQVGYTPNTILLEMVRTNLDSILAPSGESSSSFELETGRGLDLDLPRLFHEELKQLGLVTITKTDFDSYLANTILDKDTFLDLFSNSTLNKDQLSDVFEQLVDINKDENKKKQFYDKLIILFRNDDAQNDMETDSRQRVEAVRGGGSLKNIKRRVKKTIRSRTCSKKRRTKRHKKHKQKRTVSNKPAKRNTTVSNKKIS
jgi:hypothetical protein